MRDESPRLNFIVEFLTTSIDGFMSANVWIDAPVPTMFTTFSFGGMVS